MVESLTLNYKWTKPELQKSPTTWGQFLNADLDSIDALVFANQQGIVPVGSITMWAAATAPANWLICAGQTLDIGVNPQYTALKNLIGYTYGGSGTQFNLPNLAARVPWGVNAGNALGTSGGTTTITLDATMIPAHTHAASQPAHSHAATQAAHAHAIATGGHSHVIHTGSHSHTIGSGVIAGSGLTNGGVNLQVGTSSTSTAGDLGGNTDTAGNLGGNTDTQAPAITVPTATPAITVAANTGGGAAHNNMPPWLAINFIIRFA